MNAQELHIAIENICIFYKIHVDRVDSVQSVHGEMNLSDSILELGNAIRYLIKINRLEGKSEGFDLPSPTGYPVKCDSMIDRRLRVILEYNPKTGGFHYNMGRQQPNSNGWFTVHNNVEEKDATLFCDYAEKKFPALQRRYDYDSDRLKYPTIAEMCALYHEFLDDEDL